MTTRAEIAEAEMRGREHSSAMAKLLKIDVTKGDPEALAKIQHAAHHDYDKFAEIITHSKVQALFRCGALYFGKREP